MWCVCVYVQIPVRFRVRVKGMYVCMYVCIYVWIYECVNGECIHVVIVVVVVR